MNGAVFLSPYAFLAYTATIGAWIFVWLRSRSLAWASASLATLPETDRLAALSILHGPIPSDISAEEWIHERKSRLVLIAFIATLVVAAPLLLLSMREEPVKDLAAFFGVSEPEEGGRRRPRYADAGAASPQDEDSDASTVDTSALGGEGKQGEQEPKEAREIQGVEKTDEVRSEIFVGSAVDGILAEVSKKRGDDVQAGETLALVARADLDAEVKSAEEAEKRAQAHRDFIKESTAEQLEVAGFEVKSAQSILKQATLRQERLEKLKDSIASRLLEDARAAVEVAESSLALAEARLKVSKTSMNFQVQKAGEELALASERLFLARAEAARMIIKAPDSGKIKSIMNRGDAVSVVSNRPVAIIEKIEENDRPTPRSSGR